MTTTSKIWLSEYPRPHSTQHPDPRTPFNHPNPNPVTGASSGLGLAMTEHLLAKGATVIATLRTPSALAHLASKYPPSQLSVLPLDVSQRAQVAAAFAHAKAKFGRLDVVFNNAGANILGEVESLMYMGGGEEGYMEGARRAFDANFWGAVYVSAEAVRFFREVNPGGCGGRLLQMSSTLGVVGRPGAGVYAASKHALDGFSDSLAQELDPSWNIKVTIICAGPFRTPFVSTNQWWPEQHPACASPDSAASKFREYLSNPPPIFAEPAEGVKAVERLVHIEDPLLRFPLHVIAADRMRDRARQLNEDADRYES
ncbi:NAD(P)-binding protein [Coniophora puteana RWD-64-598 SS2]|uniref:NAD(P)-binding protein n=1 Tax=Coniophora puteana (strain RWD-64-598) TaxID=741705 RepID=A0A5M3MB92_CONPW|nr:NAD(P)-binding protein [Coniophora puteana RWD-64-598 SS2]EIW75895.1 NAD(P)-binding protein [Coniophora puteana RWD-64-598 SS2]